MEENYVDIEIKNINDELEKNTTMHEKLAIWLSGKIGSMIFIYFLIIFMVTWIFTNIALLLSGHSPFDEPYDFTVLLLISNSVQLLTPLFILVSQNIQGKRVKALADQEYRISKRTEEETKLMFSYLKKIRDQFQVFLNSLKIQQQKIISLEEKQEEFNTMISQNLISMLQSMTHQMNCRPCLLDDASKDPILCQMIIDTLEKYKLERPDIDK